jgi:23S rRNA (cytidine1920-2'-O)/16S rRNA (cytidine1409-2'-O)-methyltransferase
MTSAEKKRRIDQLLVDLEFAESRQKAQALLIAGKVLVDEQRVDKPGKLVNPQAGIRILEQIPFASRAGVKLQAALEHFRIDATNRVCADLGASTGGFTDCLLQRGARQVHAFDVGRGQLDWKLLKDPRVVVHDGFNVRYITAQDLPVDISLVTGDLSFISLTKILIPLKEALLSAARVRQEYPLDRPAEVVLLVKPQFEVGKGEVGKGGIVRIAAKRLAALDAIKHFANAAAYVLRGDISSPLPGAKGNEEFLLYLQLFPDLSFNT